MRVARFAAGDEVSYGLVGAAREGQDEIIAELAGHPLGGKDSTRLTGTTYPLGDVRLLAPVLPSKVIGFGMTGYEVAGGRAGGFDEGCVLYLKPSTAVCGPADPIRYPAELTRQVEAEGVLAIVIGRLCRQVPPSQAGAVVFGYACAADISARDLAERDGQWARAKGFDTFCPLGPWIETDAAPGDLALTASVNGQVRQRGYPAGPAPAPPARSAGPAPARSAGPAPALRAHPRSARLGRGVADLVAYASSVMTLLPGDVLLTGPPAGGGPPAVVEPGDELSVTIEGIGTLTNKVEKGD